MSDSAKAMVLGSFIGDALALGPHWEYDTTALAQRFGSVTGYIDPPEDSLHAGKKAGELTHYGDQTLVLLDSLAARGCFDLDDFAARWQQLFATYDGYVDGATRMTLNIFNFGEGPANSGSNSSDLAGAARVAPLVFALHGDLIALVEASRGQTKMTHNHARVIEAAEFFARTAWAVLGGKTPVAALELAAEAGYASAPISQWLRLGLASAGQETVEAIAGFGQTCHIDEAMPGVIHLIARYPRDLASCLTQNVMAGGDSAARGLLAGMVVGAAVGMAGLPKAWVGGLAAGKTIAEDLQIIAAH